MSARAFAAEHAAYTKLLSYGFDGWSQPSGADTSFPDFGLRTYVDSAAIDLHVEYKSSAKDQMGSMRDWIYNGDQFTAASLTSSKELMLQLMNDDRPCHANAKRLLNDMQSVNPDVRVIASWAWTPVEPATRREQLSSFAKKTESFMLARIESQQLGSALIEHYTRKFEPKEDASTSVLVMMLGTKMQRVEVRGYWTPTIESALCERLNVSELDVFQPPNTRLEVRIQPRGLKSGKAPRLDVMASLRLCSPKPPREKEPTPNPEPRKPRHD